MITKPNQLGKSIQRKNFSVFNTNTVGLNDINEEFCPYEPRKLIPLSRHLRNE
jgi:hypothetical protein